VGISRSLFISPAASNAPGETHSALVLSRESFSGQLLFEGSVCTLEQLRAGGDANPWETAWVVWNYEDNDHFYYLALKTNGWELGKRDPAYEGGQRFLATGDDVVFDVGAWTRFSIEQDGAVIRVCADGTELARFEDLERPYLQGRVGIYSEDATVLLDDVSGVIYDEFEYGLSSELYDGAALGEAWEVAFLGYGSGGVMAVEHQQVQAAAGFEPQEGAELAILPATILAQAGGWLFA